jgi:FkbM family methyltransferase
MNKFRHYLVQIADKLYVTNILYKLWFIFLGIRNGIHIKFGQNSILLKKSTNSILIRKGKNDFGAIGIVLRDFDNFYKTVILPNNDKLIDFSTPKFHVVDSGHTFFFHDICEPSTTTKIYLEKAKLNNCSEVVLDLGSYCGTQTVFYSDSVGPKGSVIAFEPDSNSYKSLSINIGQAKNKNIIIENKGVYSFDGIVSFTNTGGMASSISKEMKHSNSTIEVITLDSIAIKYELERCDFIKMDIEGSEIEVLNSSKKFIDKYKPRFIIEPHYINGILNTKEIIKIFLNYNYNTEIIKQGDQDYQPLIYAFPIN